MPEITVYDKLMSAVTEVPSFRGRQPDENDQTYLKRLIHLISEFPDPKWAALTEPVQAWYNQQINDDGTMKSEVQIPDGYAVTMTRRRVVTEAAPAPTLAPQPVAATGNGHDTEQHELPASISEYVQAVGSGEAPSRRKRGRKPASAAEAKPRGRKPRATNGNSVTAAIREEVTRNPSISVADLKTALAARQLEAAKETTLHQTKAAHVASLRVAQQLGWRPQNTPSV
jgi:hypothetical protein